MATKETLRLHAWTSPFARRVELALKLKGIPYEYVEENWEVKSEQLVRYNPVHKKIPVLVHNDRPICESLIIVEYIEETWKNSSRLLPEDPYERAKVRFWATFIDLKLLEQLRTILKWRREEDVKDMRDNLDKLEGNFRDIFPEGTPSSVGSKSTMMLLDILMCTFSPIIQAFDEAMDTAFLVPHKHPSIISWMKAFDELDIVKETAPSHQQLVKFFKDYKPLESRVQVSLDSKKDNVPISLDSEKENVPVSFDSEKKENVPVQVASEVMAKSQVQVSKDTNGVCLTTKEA